MGPQEELKLQLATRKLQMVPSPTQPVRLPFQAVSPRDPTAEIIAQCEKCGHGPCHLRQCPRHLADIEDMGKNDAQCTPMSVVADRPQGETPETDPQMVQTPYSDGFGEQTPHSDDFGGEEV